jgi:hypothetical protein
MLAFESHARLLHFLHLVAGVVTLASCVHLGWRLLRGRDNVRVRLHARTLFFAFLSTYSLGALIYPTFRVRVRADLLDKSYPWASGLFEIKEHAATLALLPVVAIFALTRNPAPGERRYELLLRGLVGFVLLVLVYNACVGWYLGTLRSV